MKPYVLTLILFSLVDSLLCQPLELIEPAQAGFDPVKLQNVDSAINQAIEKKEIPGAVLLILKNRKIAYNKAYGYRQLIPEQLPMTTETLFDMASLTKPVSTATAVMILLEQGKLRLQDAVSFYFPEYIPWIDPETNEKSEIRIIDLLTHTSGLPPYAHPDLLQLLYKSTSRETLFDHIAHVERLSKPGNRFKYSGLDFMTLQRLIEKLSEVPLHVYADENIFKPLQMRNTSYFPTAEQLENCAATEVLAEGVLVGTVHDPMARIIMKGSSANAGMFSTAYDMALYAAMLLNKGSWNDRRILSPLAVQAFTSLPENYEPFGRSLGWDLNSAYASNQGDLLSEQTFGHTGYTGTSMVIDPQNDLAIIFLTNRVHPDDKGIVLRLRAIVANMIAASLL